MLRKMNKCELTASIFIKRNFNFGLFTSMRNFTNVKMFSVFNNPNPKMFYNLSKFQFSRKNSKYYLNESNSDDENLEPSDYDLTELSLKEEIKFLQDKKDFKNSNIKLEKLIDYLLSKQQINEKTISEIEDLITAMLNNFRDMGLFEKSILTQEEYKKSLQSKITNEEDYDYMKIFLNDGIAFDYKILAKLDKTLKYLKENSEILRNRIKEDKLSIIRDRQTLHSNLLNLAEVMIEGDIDLNEVNAALTECLELDKQIPSSEKIPQREFKLFSLLGKFNSQLDNLEEALMYYKESLKYKRMQGIEDDEDCFRTSKEIGEVCLELGEKSTALEYLEKCITIREHLIACKSSATFDPDKESTLEDEKNHYLEIARIYEMIAEVYHDEGNNEITESLVKKAIESYHMHVVDDICTGRCYMILAEIYLEKKEYEKCIEYSKRFLFAMNKFNKEKKDEIEDDKLDFSEYSRLDYEEFLNMEYKAYKYIANSYYNLKEHFKCKKYAEMAIDKLITSRENRKSKNKEDNQSEIQSEDLNDFIYCKYELAQLYDLCSNYSMTVKEYNEVINKLQNISEDNNSLDENSEAAVDKNIILVDAYVGKAESLFKLSKYSDAKKFMIQALELIDKKNLAIQEEKIEEIRKKIELIDIKIKHSQYKIK